MTRLNVEVTLPPAEKSRPFTSEPRLASWRIPSSGERFVLPSPSSNFAKLPWVLMAWFSVTW